MLGKLRILLLCSTALVSASASAQTPHAASDAAAQSRPVFDPQQLPAFKGTAQQFTLTPRGDIDGIILSDGTEVKVPPHLTATLASAVKIGDAITIHGLRAASLPLIAASSVTNDATGASVIDSGPPAGRGPRGEGPEGPKGPAGAGPRGEGPDGPPDRAFREGTPSDMQGRVKAALHGRRGEINGALLEDGTVLRLPPPEAERLASLLAPGQQLAARGILRSNDYGKVLVVRALGASPDRLSEIAGPPDGPRGPHHGPKDHPPRPEEAMLPSSTIEAKVTRYVITPMGDVEGVLLDSGTVARTPPHMGKELVGAVKLGDPVSIEGVQEKDSTSFRVYSITDKQSQATVVMRDKKWTEVHMPPMLRSMGLKELTADGAVQTVLTGPRGDPNGVILDNGTIVRFGREAVYAASAQMKVGARVVAKGYGTENEYGRAIEANAIGDTPETMKTVVR